MVAAGTAVASNNSKPGDMLYSIDRGVEGIQRALALTDGSKKELRASLASERLKELEALLAEDQLDIPAIDKALDDFNKNKSEFDDLVDDDGTVDSHEQELEDSLESKKSEIDDAAEEAQKSLEDQREDLKDQYEQAVKDGDTVKAAALQAEVDNSEDQLKSLEDQREAAKQAEEAQKEAAKNAEEAQKQADEQDSESGKN